MDPGLIEWLLQVPSLAETVTKMAVVPAVHLRIAKKYPHVSHDAVPLTPSKPRTLPGNSGLLASHNDNDTMIEICRRPLASEAIEVQQIGQILAEIMEHLRRLNEARNANQDLLNVLFALIEVP
ncbi:hypothetical protein N7467_002829 [Penicillium canescens]|nr:hypothetical protein N7467_002829 [Penicillium canescens]